MKNHEFFLCLRFLKVTNCEDCFGFVEFGIFWISFSTFFKKYVGLLKIKTLVSEKCIEFYRVTTNAQTL